MLMCKAIFNSVVSCIPFATRSENQNPNRDRDKSQCRNHLLKELELLWKIFIWRKFRQETKTKKVERTLELAKVNNVLEGGVLALMMVGVQPETKLSKRIARVGV
ncbi:LOW QUALITY PROTEIN: hypothetical protein PanWU01x14_321330 [Parasponia andersonii]|uniref:Uncharacterized protein n=1 Tax=Parasponia andersonii TaxID=3476 RepID=A0A2P5AL44_PARAD|nr:LOW QUALITY PROTEIN: hypothetical protein PanWU01x14_321330 [Parasponia andersonii]